MDSPSIYFDCAATSPLDPRVARVMAARLERASGNPSSLHRPGREARAAVEQARQQVAALLHAPAEGIVFTGSGTEADNLALRGLLATGDHLVTSAIEHPAVRETCRFLAGAGVEVSVLPVHASGMVEPAALALALRPRTRLVSIMTANNVTGVLQPVAELAALAHRAGALFHTDAVQAVGHIPLDVEALGIDLLSLSAHKFHGPQGVGALYLRPGVALEPLIHGGGQERGLRSATENVAALAGLGAAAEIAATEMSAEAARVVGLRERLWEGIEARVSQAYLVGHRYRRLPGHLCLGFAGQEGEAIKVLLALDEAGIAVSSGSACSASHAGKPSYVLEAMGFDPIRARGSLRLSLGRFNTAEEVDRFLEILPGLVSGLRPLTTQASPTQENHDVLEYRS